MIFFGSFVKFCVQLDRKILQLLLHNNLPDSDINELASDKLEIIFIH